MAEKKYVSLSKLTKYDELLKAKVAADDAQVLVDAKAYADGLKDNYDVAGAAATVQGKLDEEVIRAKAREDEIAAAAGKAQGEVDALETLVGALPEGTSATSVVDYVNVKTAGIATDAALGELNSQVSGLQAAVQTINNDYLKSTDKTELSDAITAEANRAKGIEGGLETRLKAVEDDYLVEADKTALQNSIDTVGGKVTTLVGEDANKSVRTIANEELAKQLIAEGAGESLDTLQEIAAWIQAHPNDASAMNKAIDDLETLVGTLPEDATATTIVAYIAEVQAAVDAEKTRAEKAEGDLDSRLDVVEAQLGDGEDSVSELIATAKQEAIDAAASAADAKDAAILASAKEFATGLDTAMDARVDALEAIDHDHSNKSVLDGITEAKVSAWDAALQAADIATGATNGTISVNGVDVAVKGLYSQPLETC